MREIRVLYIRTSSVSQIQSPERQKQVEGEFDFVITDLVSGVKNFFEREGGKKIFDLIEQGAKMHITVESVDRVGRSLRDVLNTLEYFKIKNVPVHFLKEGITTLDEEGKESPTASLLINTMGAIAQLNRDLMLQRQKEGILLRISKGLYTGRQKGTKESTEKFLSKPKNKEALKLLQEGMKPTYVAKITGLAPNTITKIKKKAGLIVRTNKNNKP
ncbi:MAG: recombinase family protein [Crocinitomicaceae bacterium]